MENLVMEEKTLVAQSEMAPLTTYEIGRYLHVDLTTVISWCESGRIKAYKTPGGHRRVQPEDFLDFLKQYEMPVPKEFNERIRGVLKILVVDDEDQIRRVVRRALTRDLPQAELSEARDGFEAGKLVSDCLPKLVILDLMLPGVDGFRVCANIRKDVRLKETKILAITGKDTEENKQRIIKQGADDYLGKPFDVEVLVEKVLSLLNIEKEIKEWSLARR